MYKLLLLFFLFIGYQSYSQSKRLDSLYKALENHPQQDTVRSKLLTDIASYEITTALEKTKMHAEEALELSKKLNYQKGIGFSFKHIGSYYWRKGDLEQGIKYAFEMLSVFEKAKFAKGIGQAYILIGSIKQDDNDFDKAKEYFLKAVETHEKAGLKYDLGYDYNSLSTLHQTLKKYDEALDYNLKALKIRQEINDKNGLNQTYGNIAMAYKGKKDYAKAIEYLQKALDPTNSNTYRLSVSYANLGQLQTISGDYKNAEINLLKSVELAKNLGYKTLLSQIYENLTDLESMKGNYKKAFEYTGLHHQYKDSLFNEEKASQLAEVETRYETQKKDQLIVSLNQQKEIQDLKELYLVVGIFTLIVGSVLVFILQRFNNSKIRELLDTQKILNQKLQENDKLKSRFFANISHELRTPLTLIQAPIEEKLNSHALPSSDEESFRMIKRNANRLLALVNQLLDLSKLEANKMELRVQQGDLKTFITMLAASFDSLAVNKRVAFKKEINLELAESWFDADKLEKIINNILFNAFKFTPSGGIVSLSVYAEKSEVKIKISDTGKGISAEEQEHIFSAFYQSKQVGDEGQPGTGLGLALVKELVKLYNGNLELTSEVNKGTTITITLPVTQDKFPSEVIEKEIISATVKLKLDDQLQNTTNIEEQDDEVAIEQEIVPIDTILIVEDNVDLRNYIASLLEDKFTTLTAKDGEEALAIAINRIPNLIISDVMMPNLDGIGLTEKIKADQRTCHIPVVLLTAKADEESKLGGFEIGADDYLSKPFSARELRARVSNLIEQRKKLAAKFRAGLIEAPSPAREPSLDDKFMMKARKIVEDNISNPGFGVEQMADEISLSRAQLFRKLKAIASMSPNEFINDIRLNKAAELIRARADALTQISYSVGYNEQSYFAKRFRKKFGVTPSEYQAKNADVKA